MTDSISNEETRQRYSGIVTDETERMEHIIGDSLDLASSKAAAVSCNRMPCPARAVRAGPELATIRRCKQKHHARASRRASADRVSGGRKRLEQAIQNSAMNAVRHTPEGGHLSRPNPLRGRSHPVEDSGPAFQPSTCRGSSIASTKSTSPALGRRCPPAAVSRPFDRAGHRPPPRRQHPGRQRRGGWRAIRHPAPANQQLVHARSRSSCQPHDAGALWQVTFGTGNGNILDCATYARAGACSSTRRERPESDLPRGRRR